ncbi:MAG: flavoprotein [Candidatus Eiseniibacteriota bacterium]
MSAPARNTLAIVGAGPIGLEAALAALDAGFDVHAFERGEPGAHVLAWGHVRMFTPWRMNIGPRSRAHLDRNGWTSPEGNDCPTGAEYVERCLQPVARLPALAGRIHAHAQVVHISRRGLLKGDAPGAASRREQPFRFLVRDPGGRESFLHAFSMIDASGVFGQPNWAGDGGIPARSEHYLAPQLSYHLDDVLGLARERYAGKRVMVIGAGTSAATTVISLARLADAAPGTQVVWVTRGRGEEIFPPIANDPLSERHALYERARALARGAAEAVSHVGGARVEGLEFNSATHRYRVTLMLAEQPRVEEVERIIVNTGFGPDDSLYRELQVHECYASRGPMKLSAALLGAGVTDCLTAPAFGADVLANPEPDFFILGHKSYGRQPSFLLETGFAQVAEVVAKLTAEQRVGAPTG